MSKTIVTDDEERAKVQAMKEPPSGEHPWDKFRGIFPKEDGEELAQLMAEMFPTEK